MQTPTIASDLTVSIITSSAVSVWLIQQLKQATWFPWLAAKAKTGSRLASALLAALSAAGLQWQWTAATHTLVITNLTLVVVALGLWHWLAHFSLNEVIYQAALNKPSGPAK